MKKVILKIDGMSCSACSSGLEKYLNKQKGVEKASVNLVLAQALIEYDESLKIADLERFVSEAGFESLGIFDGKEFLLVLFYMFPWLICFIYQLFLF